MYGFSHDNPLLRQLPSEIAVLPPNCTCCVLRVPIMLPAPDSVLKSCPSGGFINSDADEQLLLFLPFSEAVKVRTIKIKANNGKGHTHKLHDAQFGLHTRRRASIDRKQIRFSRPCKQKCYARFSDDMSAPATIKVFVDRPNMDFTDTETYEPVLLILCFQALARLSPSSRPSLLVSRLRFPLVISANSHPPFSNA